MKHYLEVQIGVIKMETINLDKYTKADGQIDFDTLYNEQLPEKTLKAVLKYEKEKPTGVLSLEQVIQYDNNRKKQPFVVFSPKQKKDLKRAKKEKNLVELEILNMVSNDNGELDSKIERISLDEIVKENSYMEGQIYHRKNKRLDHYNQSETMNVFNTFNRFGKMRTIVMCNTLEGQKIAKRLQLNFGCIEIGRAHV
jgi:hypothetical protein